MGQAHAARYRLDDLRRLATALAAGAGLAPARSAGLATHLLWYDAAGHPGAGLATLPEWLGRIESGGVDRLAEGRVGVEHTATAVFDAGHGVGPLLLARAAGLAAEKAREAGVGLVRVRNLGAVGPAAAVAAEVAVGPTAAVVLGPGSTLALALPTNGGPPLVYDSALAGDRAGAAAARQATAAILGLIPLLVPEGEWLVQAVSVTAIEPLATLEERLRSELARASAGPGAVPGLLAPEALEASRRAARERGVPIAAAAWDALQARAARLGLTPPGPVGRG